MTNRRPSRPYAALAASLAACLAGCGGLLTSDQPAEHVYWLEATAPPLGESPAGAKPDLVVSVTARPGLDTDRVLVKEPGARLNHYAGARWPDHLPEVLTATVRLAFESSGRFGRVSGGTRSRRAEWLLQLELREFFAVLAGDGAPPTVHVRLAGYVDCGTGGGSVDAAAASRATEDRLAAIVASFQGATDDAVAALGRQLLGHCPGVLAQP